MQYKIVIHLWNLFKPRPLIYKQKHTILTDYMATIVSYKAYISTKYRRSTYTYCRWIKKSIYESFKMSDT